MNTKTTLLLAILAGISIASAEAQLTTNTLTFSGASWNDGGTLDGSFTIQYEDGTPTEVLSLDVTTGLGTSDGMTGYTYIYNVLGLDDTVNFVYIANEQNNGAPANELYASYGEGYTYLDWQGSNPTSLYLGDADGQYSSEVQFFPGFGVRTLSDEGGSVGPVPEPSTLALSAMGGLGALLMFRRRK